MISRKLFLSVCIFFNLAALYGQVLSPSFKKIPAQVNENLSTSDFRHKVDSLQQHSRITVTGIFKDLDLSMAQAYVEKPGSQQLFTWHMAHPHFNSRLYVHITNLTTQDTLYVYDQNGQILEIRHLGNINGIRHTFTPVREEQFIQLSRSTSSRARIRIYGMSLEPKNGKKSKGFDFGDSGPCQVNVNCAEGINYRNIQKSVVRILIKLGPSLGFCTGSIINTTNYSYEPYLLTAEHCGLISQGNYVSASDLNSWTFYFNYESADCSSPAVEGNLARQQLTGAQLLANSDDNGGDEGSDFFLLRLNSSIPASYNVFYAGWNRKGDDTPLSGATIHHPNGDIKKISTYLNAASSGAFTSMVSNTHWLVNWNSTSNGFGTTEAGSSGCPLYDEDGLIRGVLTGGAASCSSPNGKDYFGKFSYSWASNGAIPERRLRDWLDPGNTGYLALNGSYSGDSIPSVGEEISILNNPTSNGVLAIENLGTPTDDVQILVSDYSGKVVYNQKTVVIPGTPEEIGTASWRNGLYIVIILRNDEVITRKVFIRN